MTLGLERAADDRIVALVTGEARVLELVAADAPVQETLDVLARLFESDAEGMLASILLVRDGKVWHAAAPSLPAGWAQLIDGQAIGLNRGSCGAAAYLKEQVIVTDIANDVRWTDFRDAALSFGLRACWSTPILAPDREVLGTFAFYYAEPREPTARLLALAARASQLATVALQRSRHQSALAQSEQHIALIYNHSGDVLYQVRVEPEGYRFVAVNPAFTKATGLSADQVNGKWVHEVIPEPSLSIVLEKYTQAIRTKSTVRWEEVTPYPTGLRRGDVAITPVFDSTGTPQHLIGSVRDVTEQHEMAREISDLREREQLHAVLDVSPSAVAITRGDTIRYANSRFRELLGLNTGDDLSALRLEGVNVRELVAEAAGGKTFNDLEWQFNHGSGEGVDLLATCRPLHYAGEASALLHLVDVSAMKRAERSLAQVSKRLQMATRGARIGIWSWNLRTHVIEWDDVMHELYDVERDESRDFLATWRDRTHPDDYARVDAALREALRSSSTLEIDFRILRPDGSPRHVKTNAVIERDAAGTAVGLVGTNWDVTEAKRSEEAQREAREAAEAATRAKSMFLANMSHEIRTPMNAILGYAQLLHRDASLTGSQKRDLEVIHSSGQHLLGLINDILEMSKIEAGRTTLLLEPFDLQQLVREVERMFAEPARDKHLGLDCMIAAGVPELVVGDAVKVRQVLINLLGNAVKFTARGGIQIRVAASQVKGRWRIAISVDDTGAGISPADQRRIFEAFTQSESGLRGRGTGLGLAISAHFAELMDGALEVESTVGRGSTFTFSFCADEVNSLLTEASLAPLAVGLEAGANAPKVLIVDDVATNRELLVALLTRIGFPTRVATNGVEAIEVHGAWQPELILMDLRMPGMDGFETTERLRANGSAAVIIAITASGLADAEPRAREAGANGFLRKPYREPELLERIGELLGIRYVYSAAPLGAVPTGAPPDSARLAQAVRSLPPALVEELRDAAMSARAERLSELAIQARSHSENAADEIEALIRDFHYDALIAALETVSEP